VTAPGLLDGVTVLDLASVGPAARTSRWLADYGARVVKVGPTPKQGGVQIVPPFYAYAGHRDMQRALFDLKADAGRDAFLRLAAGADVVIESFRPGVVDRLGIGYEAVHAVNPGVVYCSTTGYGQEGPYSQWAGHDINYLAVGGYLDCTGRDADGGPALPGATIGDGAGGGMHAVIAILAALVHRAATGEGAYLDVSVADGVLSLMSLHLDEHLATGAVPGPRHDLLTGRLACYDVYPCRDGKWLAVGAIEPAFYANLCRALGCERWLDHQDDDSVQDRIRADFRAAFATRDRDDWVAELGPANTCVSPVASVPEVVADPHFAARETFATAHEAEHGDFRQLGRVLAGMRRDTTTIPVRAGTVTDTRELLRAAGLSDDEIATLVEEGAVA
jgi:crotonobetainyl-CoA:carnitine CoA-transferase CaiB-like acyl-CoA transferase